MNYFVPTVYAADEIYNPALVQNIQNLSGIDFLGKFLPNMITAGLIIAVVVALFFLLIGGVKWVTSGGDREALAGAQKTITAAIIGLVVTLSLYAILKVIEILFGINLVSIDIGPLIL